MEFSNLLIIPFAIGWFEPACSESQLADMVASVQAVVACFYTELVKHGQQQVCQLPWQVADRRPNGRGSMRSMALGDSECALVMLDSLIIFSMTMLFT